jgi:hypothetical protein
LFITILAQRLFSIKVLGRDSAKDSLQVFAGIVQIHNAQILGEFDRLAVAEGAELLPFPCTDS